MLIQTLSTCFFKIPVLNIIKKIKAVIPQNVKSNIRSFFSPHKNYLLLKEIEWAHVYHDSIRDKSFLKELSLNIGRMAGNYSFFYVLNRILNDFKPERILEFGLGESSKMISTYLNHYLTKSSHIVIENDEEWITFFTSKFVLSNKSELIHANVEEKIIKNRKTVAYKLPDKVTKEKFEFYLVDGPVGTDNYSRPDIITLIDNLNPGDEFVIMMDDGSRKGEQQTISLLMKKLKDKKIEVSTKDYIGLKTVTLIVTKKFKNLTTL